MSDWKDNAGLRESTEVAKIYVPRSIKAEWKHEAEERGRSLSKHLFYLVQEARYMRQQSQLPTTTPETEEECTETPRIAELEKEVTRLQRQVEQLGQRSSSDGDVVDVRLVRESLAEQCTPLEELVEEVLASPEFQRRVKTQVKQRLFGLGADRRADYVRGHGWRLEE